MKIHEFIKQRIAEGMTQTAFARKCGVSQALVNNVLQGHTKVQEHIVAKIATAYGLPLSSFLEDAPNIAVITGSGGAVAGGSAVVLTRKQQILLQLCDDEELLDGAIKYTEKEKLFREVMQERDDSRAA